MGMNTASIHSKYCEDVDKELSKIAIEEVQEDMEDILNRFYKLNEQLKDRMYKEKADEIFRCIPMKMEKFYDRFDKECMNIPIFKYQDPRQMFQRISCASNEDIVLIKEKLINRANTYTKEIESEIPNIEQLKEIIDEYTIGKEVSIKNVMLKEFAKDLGYIIDKYKVNNLVVKEEE